MCPVFATTAVVSSLALQITAASTFVGIYATAFAVSLAFGAVLIAGFEIQRWRRAYLAQTAASKPTREQL